ncbi:lipoprotein [Streptomyces sp. Mg1]|nr:lipoprotein [Streptomyces sp. Mg1]
MVSATLLALAGCQDDDGKTGANGAKDGRNPVIAPGKPGERARTLSPEQAARERPDDTPNAADQTYVRGMIEHHRQALTMSALAPDRASAEAVKGLAERIAAAQKPEIGAMERWLARYPAPGGAGAAGGAGGTGGMGGHDHGAMPGMATEQQLKELADARGTDFDRLFLKLMTAHHEGALKMAGQALAGGNNVAVEEMATEVVATQTAEIHRMRALG